MAVSGGVDSVSLLHALAKRGEYRLDVAFIDHGWRDVKAEREIVRALAHSLGCNLHEASLSLQGTAEEEARIARYGALEEIQTRVGTTGIILAHHADDRIETAILNALRGTGRRGLSSLQSTDQLIRPLLNVRKQEIVQYARAERVSWAEDPTNKQTNYRRNWIRHELLPQLRSKQADFDERLLIDLDRTQELNQRIDTELNQLFELAHSEVVWKRATLRKQSIEVVQESLVFGAHRVAPGAQLNRRTIERLAVDIKSARFLATRALTKQLSVRFTHDTVAIAFKAR